MHPASSIIYFTVASGFGFGYLFFLALGIPAVEGQTAFWSYAVGYALAVTGLCASLFHLGNPQRAWKALSQWQTSWLSREGVVAILAMGVLAPQALSQIAKGPDFSFLGWIAAALCILTVFCTSMIYGQLKTVPRWRQPLTPLVFLAYAITGGAMLAQVYEVALIGALAVLILQILHWFVGDMVWRRNPSDASTATGLGHLGTVRLLERPHTGKNYLTTEMVHLLARKHSLKLRGITFILLVIAALIALFGSYGLWVACTVLALGTFVSRWLFFAEAEHVVGLYYDRPKG